jgi:hypothetical protein
MSRPPPLLVAGTLAAVVAALLCAAGEAQARPQWNTGLIPAGCIIGDHDAAFERVAFCGQARADVLFLRERTDAFGLGPYVALGSAAFEDLRLSAGATALIPIVEDFPLVLSLGGLARDAESFGLSASAFWGLRSYNFHSGYNLAFGFVLSGERTFGEASSNAISLGFQVDGLVLAMPFLLLVGAAQ